MTREPRDWTHGRRWRSSPAWRPTPAIALTNAELFEPDRDPGRAARDAAGGLRPDEPGVVGRGVGRIVVEETRRIIDYHNARVYLVEPPDQVVPIAFEGRVGAYEQVDMELLRCRLGEGFTGWVAQHGEPILVNDANADPRGATIAGTDDIDESMLVVPMRYDGETIGVITLSKLGPRRLRRRRPAGADDPRRPGRDRRRVGPPAVAAARPSPASCGACST